MNWLLLSTIGCSLFVLFTSSGTEKSSIRKTLLGIFLFPSASFCLMLKNQDRLLSLLEGSIPCGFYETLKAHYAPEFIIFLYGSISLASIYFCLDLSLARDICSEHDLAGSASGAVSYSRKKMPEALLKLLIVLAFSLITLSLHNAGRVVIESLPISRRERLLIAIPAVLGFLLFSSLTFSENYTTTLPDFFMIKDRQEEGLVYLAAALGIIAGLITLEFRK